MAQVTVTKALSQFFNVGEGKRGLVTWRDELAAMTDGEKRKLALEVCAFTGDTLAS